MQLPVGPLTCVCQQSGGMELRNSLSRRHQAGHEQTTQHHRHAATSLLNLAMAASCFKAGHCPDRTLVVLLQGPHTQERPAIAQKAAALNQSSPLHRTMLTTVLFMLPVRAMRRFSAYLHTPTRCTAASAMHMSHAQLSRTMPCHISSLCLWCSTQHQQPGPALSNWSSSAREHRRASLH